MLTSQVMDAACRIRLSSEGDLTQRIWWEYLFKLRTLPSCNAVWKASKSATKGVSDPKSQNIALARPSISGKTCKASQYHLTNYTWCN